VKDPEMRGRECLPLRNPHHLRIVHVPAATRILIGRENPLTMAVMAYCPKCSSAMGERDVSCAHCGYDFPLAPPRRRLAIYRLLASIGPDVAISTAFLGCGASLIMAGLALYLGNYLQGLMIWPIAFLVSLFLLYIFTSTSDTSLLAGYQCRFQFRIRTVLVVMLELALILGCIGPMDCRRQFGNALDAGDYRRANLLLRLRPDLARDGHLAWRLYWAASQGDITTAEFLLEHRANPNGTDRECPLSEAAQMGDVAMVDLLLEHGANPDGNGTDATNTPLNAITLVQGPARLAVAQSLLDHGADPNLKGRNGWTLLYWAALQDDAKLCQVLLAGGADPDTKNNEGTTPRDMALLPWHTNTPPLFKKLPPAPSPSQKPGR
jgi:hypothetical protein